jgi:predicted dehydrogenase
MSDATLRIGLAGVGAMGRNHLRVIGQHPHADVVAIADPNRPALDEVTAAAGAKGYGDARAMIDEAALDAVVVATPTTFHLDVALAAIEKGLPVLIEKPLAATTEEARRIVAAATARGVPVQVGHVERFNPAVQKLGRLLAGGWLSNVYALASRRAGPFPARIRDVGVTIDLATHDADILSWVAGERPTRVFAETARRIHTAHEDLLFGLLHFPGGATGMLDVNWLTPAKRRQLVVVGSEGMFELDYLTQRLTFTRTAPTDDPRLIRGFAPTFDGELVEIAVEAFEPLVAEIDAFLRVVRTGERPMVDADDGLWAVAVAEALLASAISHAAVSLEDLAVPAARGEPAAATAR